MSVEFPGNQHELPPTTSGDHEPDPCLFYYDARGNQIGIETITNPDKGPVATYRVTDSAGVEVLRPIAQAPSLILEGVDPLLGMEYYTSERDVFGRPKRIIGLKIARGVITNVMGENVGAPDEEVAPDVYEEYLLNYDPATGLLGTVYHAEESFDDFEKEMHRFVYDDEGRLTGHVRSVMKGMNIDTGRETYDIDEVNIYERHDTGWRVVTYTGFRDGLMPTHLEEGTAEPPFSWPDTWYMRPVLPEEQLPYEIARNPISTTMIEQRSSGIGKLQSSLPSWLPKAAAYYLAAQAITPEEAAEYPRFPEERGTKIMTREEAYRKLLEMDSEALICEFINELRTKESVVLQYRNVAAPLIRDLILRSTPQEGLNVLGHLSDVQKIGAIAVMHPAFARESILSLSKSESRNDGHMFEWLLGWLGVEREWVENTVLSLDDRLSVSAQTGFGYLLIEDEPEAGGEGGDELSS